MFTSRKLIVYVVLALMLFVGVSSVAASTNSHQVVKNFSVGPFTIPAGQCSSLPAGVSITGTGEGHYVASSQTMPDGSSKLVESYLEKGTATDSNGGTHKFVYASNSTDTTLLSGQHEYRISDSFELTGPGLHYGTHLNWRWTYTPPELNWPPAHDLEQLSTRGDPVDPVSGAAVCDPL